MDSCPANCRALTGHPSRPFCDLYGQDLDYGEFQVAERLAACRVEYEKWLVFKTIYDATGGT